MKKIVIITFLMSIGWSCRSSEKPGSEKHIDSVSNELEQSIVLGAEQLDAYVPLLQNKRVALVVNQTSVMGHTHLVDSLRSLHVNVVKVFAPEHGFRGKHSAGAFISNGKDVKTGLSVVSLYGKNKKPTSQMLADVDVVVFDIQDVGVRFYTYISTMHYVMEACAEQGKKVVVLDRPNPNGFYIDGPVLEPAYKSFIGMHAIPLVHGLTVAELAQMINGEKWLSNGTHCDLTVVPCLHYTHNTLYELPIKPSPNLPNMASVYLYPYLGLFEGTNVSIGRGTDLPFQVVGRPGEKGNYTFTPKSIPGVSDHPKYEGKECVGEIASTYVQDSILSKGRLNLSWLLNMYETNTPENGPYFKDFFYKLSGNKTFKSQVVSGLTEEEIRKSWQADLDIYKNMRKKYLLYP